MIKKIKFVFAFILLISFTVNLFAQKNELNFTNKILNLNEIGKKIISEESDSLKMIYNQKYNKLLLSTIQQKGSFEYNFDSLKTISILKANNLKIYNWAVPKTDGSFQYFAFLQIRLENKSLKIVSLTDNSENIKSPLYQTLTPDSWYGALYYKIIYDKKFKVNYYTVLGWDGNNNLTNKKIIDVISVSKNGTVKLGAPIFKMERKTQKRVIFEYSDKVVMSLKFIPKNNEIVFDYLAPPSDRLKRVYEYYGPTLNRFDGLLMDKNKWVYQKDVNVELDRSIKDHMWHDPKK